MRHLSLIPFRSSCMFPFCPLPPSPGVLLKWVLWERNALASEEKGLKAREEGKE